MKIIENICKLVFIFTAVILIVLCMYLVWFEHTKLLYRLLGTDVIILAITGYTFLLLDDV